MCNIRKVLTSERWLYEKKKMKKKRIKYIEWDWLECWDRFVLKKKKVSICGVRKRKNRRKTENNFSRITFIAHDWHDWCFWLNNGFITMTHAYLKKNNNNSKKKSNQHKSEIFFSFFLLAILAQHNKPFIGWHLCEYTHKRSDDKWTTATLLLF